MQNMFSNITSAFSFIQKPDIPVRIPNDDTSFNPKEYPHVIVSAEGKMSGKVLLVHGGTETDESGLGLISTRVWVVNEADKEQVVITASFDKETHTYHLETPKEQRFNAIYYETMVQYPSATTSASSLSFSLPNTSLSGSDLSNLAFGSIKTALSNGSIALQDLNGESTHLQTSNGSVSGSFNAGHIDLDTTNGAITAKINVRDAQDGSQSRVNTRTTNGRLDIHTRATQTTRGLWMNNSSTNGRVTVGALLKKADRTSVIHSTTNNGKVEVDIDASLTDQPLEVKQSTSNGAIRSNLMIPIDQPFQGHIQSSNGSVEANLTEAFRGTFDLSTSHSSATVEGTDLTLTKNSKSAKLGFRGAEGPSHIQLSSSNASVALRFYPAGESLAAKEG
ncbi:hypothetical protein BG015_011678 [Linnemannia schmuckeri]|uniref:Adhesin domain-containing protein n=1 Tax=Linnemannia schmuckeri TaxID=64567 RepID=A0A9P5S746_9FUNG|nr:hypothetical protein BG015_011678 [Linnemannia schmuckeri]